MKRLEKNLDMHFDFIGNRCEVTVLEPESGVDAFFSFTVGSDFDKESFRYEMGWEILSWVSMWTDEMKEMDETESEEETENE